MKALIIIVVLVAVSFIGLLVYGESRSGRAGDTAKDCHQWPVAAGKDPSKDDLERWCPPKLADATRGLQARFAPGLKLKEPAMLDSSSRTFPPASFVVPTSDTKMRAAHIELVKGNAAILSHGDDQLCLCRPHLQIDDRLLQGACPNRWKRKHLEDAKPAERGFCQAGDESGILPFKPEGGLIEIQPQPQAVVQIK